MSRGIHLLIYKEVIRTDVDNRKEEAVSGEQRVTHLGNIPPKVFVKIRAVRGFCA